MKTEPKNESPAPKKTGRKRKPAAEASTTAAEIRGKMAVIAGGLGLDVPDEAGERPTIDLAAPVEVLGRELGRLSHRTTLFLRGGEFVTVDAATGETRGMDPARFCGFAESVAWPFRVRGDEMIFSRVPVELARVILAADAFRNEVRPLRGVSTVRLPVWRGGIEENGVDLLPAGYDPASQFFTVDGVPFDAAADVHEARKWWLDLFGGFPFADERSRAAFAVLMLQSFARLLLARNQKLFHGVFLANQAGSGKTLLAAAALAPVYGLAAAQGVDRNMEELRNILDTAALEGAPYLFLDDMGSLRSRPLNSFMTSPKHKPRIKGKSESREVDLDCVVFVTGNGIDIGPEIARRSLLVDLFLREEAAARRFPSVLTPASMASRETRAGLLAFLFAVLRHWCEQGRPVDKEATRGGFESVARLCGSVIRCAVLGNPFAPRGLALGGDEEGAAIKSLLQAAAQKVHPGGEYRPGELVELAEAVGLLDAIAGWAKSPAQALGQRLKLWRGRRLEDEQGRVFQFGNEPRYGRKRDRGGSVYEIRYLDKPGG